VTGREPQTHDYSRSRRGWGHDYTFKSVDGGQRGEMTGWGRGIREGDFLLLDNKGRSSRYRVDEISHYMDPDDMWSAKVSFAPRTAG
jgi:hypothetical protein